ncbi:PTS lactose/cellobiose transporter subunit IIA [Listeria seeligeri]|uniref:PTS lactose/cellobiose transporter subunit IIA n=1 Tax=Listeria seeligeri TaxID=1640 RepID=UPI0016283299|nr:PTS lactose/cellobiose transporter subunit IIA [Listeria seeligeri]MBC2202822.1 PTS lactose/cellobiose transporter subunit IIA [Listeria seeligeri]MBF2563174.1 PTS lactose/cellobiose transporter subunit IIA [Listeria seeligeri]
MEIQVEEAVVKLIFHGGNTRKEAYTAIDYAEKYQFDEADKHLQLAQAQFQEGHIWQTKLVSLRDSEAVSRPSFLLIHGQDHLMTAQAELQLAKRIIEQYKHQERLEERLTKLEQQA